MERDRVFALANIYPEVLNQICVEYSSKRPILEMLIEFYGFLAKQDLSILCFHQYGNYIYTKLGWNKTRDEIDLNNVAPIQKYDLPSWTGVNGEHVNKYFKTSFGNYTITGRIMQVTCAFIMNATASDNANNKGSAFTLQYDDIPPLPHRDDGDSDNDYVSDDEEYDSGDDKCCGWRLFISVEIPSYKNGNKAIVLPLSGWPAFSGIVKQAKTHLQKLSHFFPIEKEKLSWWDTTKSSSTAILDQYVKEFAFRITEDLDDSTDYAILCGIQFEDPEVRPRYTYCPIVKKEGDH